VENVSGCSDSVLSRILLLRSSVHGTAKYMSRPGARLIVGWRNRLVRPGGGETDRPPVDLDRAVTFVPSGDVVVAALGSLRKGDVVAINAIHLDRILQFDYDSLLWGERQLRSVPNITRSDARNFLQIASEINLRSKVTVFSLDQANETLAAVKGDAIDGAVVIVP
jgi:alcohol dehydrogenase, propanol-preferring